ncbi:MAG: 30S ribosomal protein S4e [Nanoarchaeota archaeon]|nr:30S ribosomal protein S4e [Nanoarchaeota archaeon]
MVKNHLLRLNAPKSWPIGRKGIVYIRRPNAGAHSLQNSIPLSLVLTNLLDYVRTRKEVKKILYEGKIIVNNKVRKDPSFPVGIMDIVSIPSLNETHRVIYNTKGKFAIIPVEKENAIRLVKLVNKTILGKDKVQLNFFDGTNIIIAKNNYKVEDTLFINMKDKTVQKHLRLEKGAVVYLTGGKKIGEQGVLEEIKEDKIIVKINESLFETARRYAFVIGDAGVVKK